MMSVRADTRYVVKDLNGLRYTSLTTGAVLGPDKRLMLGWRIRRGRHGADPCSLCGRTTRFRDPKGRRRHPFCNSFVED